MGIFRFWKNRNRSINPLSNEAILEAAPSIDRLIGEVKTLLSRYIISVKQYPWINSNGILDIKKALRHVSPKADALTCPYCGVMHDKPATRGRQCSSCGKKYIVRDGLIYKGDVEERIYKLFGEYSDGVRYIKLVDKLDSDKSSAISAVYESIQCMILKHDYDTAWRMLNRAYVTANELDDYFLSIDGLQNWADNVARVRELQTQVCAHQASYMDKHSPQQRSMALRAIIISFLFIHERAKSNDRDALVGKTVVDGEVVNSIFHDYHDDVHEAIDRLGDMISQLKIDDRELETCYQRAQKMLGGEDIRPEVREFMKMMQLETQ